jgi:secreted PhoX family phosphatase
MEAYTKHEEAQAVFDGLEPHQKNCVYMRVDHQGKFIYRYLTLREENPDYLTNDDLVFSFSNKTETFLT